ncbi:MAG TPA: DUF6263 family protein, partial [Chitinophagaceae bacterium]|nr:DUF6263 family protein [Chitinophagaceae bacterium]
MKKFILSLSVVSIFQTGFGQKQTLGFNLTIGETYYQITRAETNITQEINNQKTSIDMTVFGKMAYKITGFNDSSYEMNANYQELSITMNLPNDAMTFSSEKDDENDLVSIMLSALKDKPFFMKMTTTGKIVEIKNLDSLFDGMFDKAPLLPPEQKQQMKAQLMQAYGERALKGSMEMVTAIYPDRPV